MEQRARKRMEANMIATPGSVDADYVPAQRLNAITAMERSASTAFPVCSTGFSVNFRETCGDFTHATATFSVTAKLHTMLCRLDGILCSLQSFPVNFIWFMEAF
jgi:hypothetical protein